MVLLVVLKFPNGNSYHSLEKNHMIIQSRVTEGIPRKNVEFGMLLKQSKGKEAYRLDNF